MNYKKAFYVIWDVPPTTGQPFYDFFDVNAGYTTSLDNQCGSKNVPLAPISQINDPKLGRIDDTRKAGKSIAPADRVPPGDMGSIGFSNNCHYIENTRGTAQIKCDDNVVVDCHVPDETLVQHITAKNGACGDTPNVRMLVMVSLHIKCVRDLIALLGVSAQLRLVMEVGHIVLSGPVSLDIIVYFLNLQDLGEAGR